MQVDWNHNPQEKKYESVAKQNRFQSGKSNIAEKHDYTFTNN